MIDFLLCSVKYNFVEELNQLMTMNLKDVLAIQKELSLKVVLQC